MRAWVRAQEFPEPAGAQEGEAQQLDDALAAAAGVVALEFGTSAAVAREAIEEGLVEVADAGPAGWGAEEEGEVVLAEEVGGEAAEAA